MTVLPEETPAEDPGLNPPPGALSLKSLQWRPLHKRRIRGHLFAIVNRFHKRLSQRDEESLRVNRARDPPLGDGPGPQAPLSLEDPFVCFLLLQSSHFLRKKRTHECIQ